MGEIGKESLDDSNAILKSVHFKTGREGLSFVFQEVIRWGFPGEAVVKNLLAGAGDAGVGEFNPWVRKISWSRKWQPTPVFLPEKFHGKRSLEEYNPWGSNELTMTEHAHKCTHIYTTFY